MTNTYNFPAVNICYPTYWEDYELVDSGGGRKLERYGSYLLIRPEAEAVWKPALPEKEWQKAAAEFLSSPEENGGHWNIRSYLPSEWTLHYRDLYFKVLLGGSRHVGVFPEQAVHWDWMARLIGKSKRPLKVLNLFGYTGLATISAASAGAAVTHVDASRKAVTWAHENQDLSHLSDRPIRWIVDDAVKYIHRQARREEKFDALILDPPKFGRGPKGEVWEFYKLLPELLQACRESLCAEPVFVALTAYAVKASSITIAQSLQQTMQGLEGNIFSGELALKEKSAGRLLSTAVFALWSSLPVELD